MAQELEIIDFRSDTVTRPTAEMRAAMMSAEVGDDVYGEDPSVLALEARGADMFGKEAALFCPSGTMCNQIAIRISTRPQDEVICDSKSHIYLYEGGGIAAQSLASVALVEGNRGRLSARQIEEAIRPDDLHYPRTSLVSLENTSNKGGGSCYELSEIRNIRQVCDRHGLRLHLDGARIFNALVARQENASVHGALFDTLSVCLSKGLGAPVGSLLLGSAADIKFARRVRKMMGGGMRQAGFLAAAGLYALDHHITRLAEDHRRAQTLAAVLKSRSWLSELLPVETNLIVFRPDPAWKSDQQLLAALREQGILASGFGSGYVRIALHLDISEGMMERTCEVLSRL
ncbi:MAG: aminotransferase class I/II-fold pyridoxal phosphate-dependent enzyme [Bacteroidetes bacterium]|nr:MAG: aminotransferase class I/II-fold pyridoxal phosphate-dependent enzyme [Bacteroidota bacterium]